MEATFWDWGLLLALMVVVAEKAIMTMRNGGLAVAMVT